MSSWITSRLEINSKLKLPNKYVRVLVLKYIIQLPLLQLLRGKKTEKLATYYRVLLCMLRVLVMCLYYANGNTSVIESDSHRRSCTSRARRRRCSRRPRCGSRSRVPSRPPAFSPAAPDAAPEAMQMLAYIEFVST